MLQTPVQALAFSPGGRWALSAAGGERHVAIWATAGQAGAKAPGKEKKRKAAAAAGLLALEEPAVSLATAAAAADGDEDACFQVLLCNLYNAYAYTMLMQGLSVRKTLKK